MQLYTERLIIRDFTRDDIDALFTLLSDSDVNRFLPWFTHTTREETERFFYEKILRAYTNGGFFLAVCLKEDAVPVGYASLSDTDSHDLGYALKKEFWRQGIISEAARALMAHICESRIPYITATHDRQNLASGKVMKNIGMTYRYLYKELVQPKNTLVTFRMYQINLDGNRERVYKKYWNNASGTFYCFHSFFISCR